MTSLATQPDPQPTPPSTRRTGRWIDDWGPENPAFWESTGRRVARRNLMWSIFGGHLGFSVGLLWSVCAALLTRAGFAFTPQQHPTRLKGTALGLNAAGANLGVSVIQFFLPIIVGGAGAFGLVKASGTPGGSGLLLRPTAGVCRRRRGPAAARRLRVDRGMVSLVLDRFAEAAGVLDWAAVGASSSHRHDQM